MCVPPIMCRPAVQLTRPYSPHERQRHAAFANTGTPGYRCAHPAYSSARYALSHSVADNEFRLDDFCAVASTTTVSKSILVPEGAMGGLCNLSEGSYHGCFSTTPF
jgi:hypothetical protein